MHQYQAKTFNIPALTGISPKQVEEHLKLYAGYVKHSNLITEKVAELEKSTEDNSYMIQELLRRLGFEWDGMKLHEYYFRSIEKDASTLQPDSALGKMMTAQYGSFENWLEACSKMCLTRGIGWVILYYDVSDNNLIMKWVDEHQIGHLAGLQIVMVVDVWEHAYMIDYLPSEKKDYVRSYLSNINWSIVSEDFESLLRAA
jgi:Fe-Mn family superoxide dismutase